MLILEIVFIDGINTWLTARGDAEVDWRWAVERECREKG